MSRFRPARTFFDGSYFDGINRDQKVLFPKYAMAAIREKLLQGGALLADNRQTADMIVEARTGGQSVDHNSLFIVIPSISIPVPPTFYPIPTPELALFKRDRQTGVAKLAIVAYRQANGAYAASSGPSFGSSNHTETTILLVFDNINSDIEPKISRAGHIRPGCDHGCRKCSFGPAHRYAFPRQDNPEGRWVDRGA